MRPIAISIYIAIPKSCFSQSCRTASCNKQLENQYQTFCVQYKQKQTLQTDLNLPYSRETMSAHFFLHQGKYVNT